MILGGHARRVARAFVARHLEMTPREFGLASRALAALPAAGREIADADADRVASAAQEEVRLLPIRPRSRGERRSLRTFPVVTLHPRFPFNV
jgi:hypothetical protein